MNFDNIPQELKLNGLWCLWKLKPNQGKVPYDATTMKFAKSNDKSTFHSFQKAFSVVHKVYGFDENNKMTGGLGLGIFNDFSAVDIDNCRDPKSGELSEMAEDIIDYCGSYTEVSPSGTGVRIIFKTDTRIDKNEYYINNHQRGLEIYISENTNKYVTITGNAIFPNEIKKINLKPILDKYMQKKKPKNVTPSTRQDGLDKKIQFALNKDKHFFKLWNTVAPGSGANESEIDLALCNKIAYYADCDEDKINDIFVQSPYFQSKDDAHKDKWLERDDYRKITIEKAVDSLIDFQEQKIDENDFNDTGNAYKLVERFGEIIRYNVDNSRWMVYNDKYWQTDVYNNVRNFAEIIAEDFRQRAMIEGDSDKRKDIYKNVKRILSSNGKSAMLKEAEHVGKIPVSNSEFDKEPHLLNCESGVIDLKTGDIQQHDREMLLSKFAPYKLTKEKPKLWLKFLDDVFEGDKEVIDYVHKVAGYSITGSMREQSMFILFGDGANGKSLFLEMINIVAGSYGATSNVEILLEKRNNQANLGDVARLNKIRNVVTDETKIGDKLNESAIKTMTSGIGKIVARYLYGNEFEFTPIFKIFMATNHKPVIRGTDHGIWRRLKLIPFNRVFSEEEQDKDLVDKLKGELDGIFTWAVEGAKKWYKEGLKEPTKLKQVIKEYRTEMDLIQQWIDEACDTGERHRESAKDLFENFSNYVSMNKEFQMSQTLFGRNMAKKFNKRRIAGVMYYEGVRLKKDSIYWLSKEEHDEV